MTVPIVPDLPEKIIAFAKKAGADEAEAIFSEAEGVSVAVRLGEMEDIEREARKALGVRVFCGNKTTSLSTTDLAEAALKELAEKAVQIAKQSPGDPFAQLAGPDIFSKTPGKDLQVFDDTIPDVETLKDLALDAENAGRKTPGITNSGGASAGWKKFRRCHVTSKGFKGEQKSSIFSFYTVLVAGEGTAMERDYDFSTKRFFGDLDNPEKIGKKAAGRALKRLHPKPVKSQTVPVIFHRRVAESLLGHFSAAVNGKKVSKGTTFLVTDLGKGIFAKDIRIIDDPTIKRGLASKAFDGEGLAAERLDLVTGGILAAWLLDLASAAEMGLESNGRAGRSLAGSPSPASTNLYMENGKKSLDEMIKAAGKGLLITDLIGMGVNPVTGDYSRGASGFWFESGEVAFPVSGITVAGNLKDMFKTLEPAGDLKFKQGINSPSLFVPDMTVAGT